MDYDRICMSSLKCWSGFGSGMLVGSGFGSYPNLLVLPKLSQTQTQIQTRIFPDPDPDFPRPRPGFSQTQTQTFSYRRTILQNTEFNTE